MHFIRVAALCGASFLAFGASRAVAQSTELVEQTGVTRGQPQDAQEIVVLGEIGYRNRSASPEPVLVYDTEYFQRFEPLTIGDALKRVPSVTFLSDVIESDGARLRGLDPGYTQILINGEKVPGSNADRSFFLDRIPAELVDRVEIVRSSSARRTADAVAGTLNIVLRDAYKLDGGYVRAGGLRFDDGEVKPNFGAVYGGEVGPGRLLVGGNVQGRYNPKKKTSRRFEPDDDSILEFDNREDQDDTRDGTDYSFNSSYAVDAGGTKFELSGFYVRTDRTESERSLEYDDPDAETGPVGGGGNLLTDADQFEDIDQRSYSLAAKLGQEWAAGETRLRLGFSRFAEDVSATELEIDFEEDEPEFAFERVLTDIKDREFTLGLDHAFPLASGVKLIAGGYYQDKKRHTDIASSGDDYGLDALVQDSYDQFQQGPADFESEFEEYEPVAGGLNRIREKRRDVFALIEGKTAMLTWEAGVRYEHTKLNIDDLDSGDRFGNNFGLVLPSASVKLDLSKRDRFTASVARTNRRQRFDFLSPAVIEEELGDNDLRGNPDLKPETAWGLDLGYERRLGRTGVAGVNVFYRKVSDLTEIANTGLSGSEDDEDTPEEIEAFIYEPRNSGNGKAWGVEVDLSASLGIIGLRDTGVFGNLSLLDSEIRDFAGKRRFNGQSSFVYNAGFIQNLPTVAAAFGATFRKQGRAFDRLIGQEVRTTYGTDLEVFVEKTFFNRLTVRAVGSNLLNSRKRETFRKFDTEEDQLNRDLDEYELESEKAGPVFQLVARVSF